MRAKNNDRIKILIAEYIPSLNKGELSILKGILKSFEILGKTDVSIFSLNPEIDRERYPPYIKLIDVQGSLYLRKSLFVGSEISRLWSSIFAALQHLLFIFLFSFLGSRATNIMDRPLWKAYIEHDVFILCHDEVDIVNGAFLKFSPIYISMLAKRLEKLVVFYANGTNISEGKIRIGRFHSRCLWKILAKFLLSIVDLVTVRDEDTLRYFKELTNGKVPIYLTADPAFISPYKKEVDEIMLLEKIPENGKLLIGITVSHGIIAKVSYQKAITEIAKCLDKLVKKFNSTILFIPHSIEPYDYRDDRLVSKDIYYLMKNKCNTKIITNEYSPEELKGLFGRLDLLITTRVHAAINAISMGVPVCIIALRRDEDERPYSILGKTLGLNEFIYNIHNIKGEDLFLLIEKLLKLSRKMRKQVLRKIDSAKKKAELNGKLLKCLIASHRSKELAC
jgi:colanic acid/amylovoran biosynthesis protein